MATYITYTSSGDDLERKAYKSIFVPENVPHEIIGLSKQLITFVKTK